MPDGFDNDRDSSDVQREAVVEMANLTNGMMGGIFDQRRAATGILGMSRPQSTVIWRVRVTSAAAGLTLGVLMIASPLILGLIVGPSWGVTVGLGIAALAAGLVWVGSYVAERREVIRRTAREESDA